MPAVTQSPPWSNVILDQLAEADVPPTAQYAVVHVPLEGNPYIVEEGFSATETGALIVQDDFANTAGGGEVHVVKLANLQEAAEAQATFETTGDPDEVPEFAADPELETTAAEVYPEMDQLLRPTLESDLDRELADGTAAGPDPDAGKLFDVPRVTVQPDESDPSVLKLSFSGLIELDRGIAADVDFYNRVKAGQTVHLEVDAHVAGAKTTHRRDSDGNVDAIVQTKSLIVHSLDTE